MPEADKKYLSKYLLKRLLVEHVKPYRIRISLAIICMIVAALTTALQAWLLQPALDKIFLAKDREMLILIPVAILLISLIGGMANYGQNIIMRFVGQRIIADMQIRLFRHLIHSDMKVFNMTGTGNFISRFTNDIQMMRNSVSIILTGLAKELVTMIFLIAVMFYQNWQLSLVACLVFPIIIYPMLRMARRMRKLSDQTQQELGDFTSKLDESLKSIRIVKSYIREDFEIRKNSESINRLFNLYYKSGRIQSLSSPLIESIGGIAVAGIILYGGLQVIDGVTTPGSFFSFIVATIMAYRPSKVISNMNTNLQEGLAAASRLFAVLYKKPEITNKKNSKKVKNLKGEIIFDKVNFSYSNHSKIGEVDLHIKPGMKIVLVGPSGGGKSTLADLLMRFFDVSSGRILIDGVDIRDLRIEDLRRNISLISQDSHLLDASFAENIAYGKIGASKKDIVKAARIADAENFIKKTKHGYNTRIGASGEGLSGGQKQRISIARALLKSAPILILDEATSALDRDSESKIHTSLRNFIKNKTTIIIEHRLTSVTDADLIIFMKNGRITETGSHKILMAKKSDYYRLYTGHKNR